MVKSNKPNFRVKHPYGYLIQSILIGLVMVLSGIFSVAAYNVFTGMDKSSPSINTEAVGGVTDTVETDQELPTHYDPNGDYPIIGSGTSADPFLVTSWAELLFLNHVAKNVYSYDELYISIANDIFISSARVTYYEYDGYEYTEVYGWTNLSTAPTLHIMGNDFTIFLDFTDRSDFSLFDEINSCTVTDLNILENTSGTVTYKHSVFASCIFNSYIHDVRFSVGPNRTTIIYDEPAKASYNNGSGLLAMFSAGTTFTNCVVDLSNAAGGGITLQTTSIFKFSLITNSGVPSVYTSKPLDYTYNQFYGCSVSGLITHKCLTNSTSSSCIAGISEYIGRTGFNIYPRIWYCYSDIQFALTASASNPAYTASGGKLYASAFSNFFYSGMQAQYNYFGAESLINTINTSYYTVARADYLSLGTFFTYIQGSALTNSTVVRYNYNSELFETDAGFFNAHDNQYVSYCYFYSVAVTRGPNGGGKTAAYMYTTLAYNESMPSGPWVKSTRADDCFNTTTARVMPVNILPSHTDTYAQTTATTDSDGYYLVDTPAKMMYVDYLSRYMMEAGSYKIKVKLTANIDMSGYLWAPLVDYFTGGPTIDGAGFTISNLTMDQHRNAAVGNTTILTGSSTGTRTPGYAYALGLIGNIRGAATIQNLKMSATNIITYSHNYNTFHINRDVADSSEGIHAIYGAGVDSTSTTGIGSYANNQPVAAGCFVGSAAYFGHAGYVGGTVTPVGNAVNIYNSTNINTTIHFRSTPITNAAYVTVPVNTVLTGTRSMYTSSCIGRLLKTTVTLDGVVTSGFVNNTAVNATNKPGSIIGNITKTNSSGSSYTSTITASSVYAETSATTNYIQDIIGVARYATSLQTLNVTDCILLNTATNSDLTYPANRLLTDNDMTTYANEGGSTTTMSNIASYAKSTSAEIWGVYSICEDCNYGSSLVSNNPASYKASSSYDDFYQIDFVLYKCEPSAVFYEVTGSGTTLNTNGVYVPSGSGGDRTSDIRLLSLQGFLTNNWYLTTVSIHILLLMKIWLHIMVQHLMMVKIVVDIDHLRVILITTPLCLAG